MTVLLQMKQLTKNYVFKYNSYNNILA